MNQFDPLRSGARQPPPPQQQHQRYQQQQQHQHQSRPPHQAPPPGVPPQTPPQAPSHVAPTPEQLAFLQSQGFPPGMIHSIANARTTHPLRIWILDNGTLMNQRDAHILQPNYQQTSATRWEELKSCVAYHADLYTRFALPTRFALLNSSNVAPQFFSLMQTGNLAQEQQVLGQVLSLVPPNGPTPLTTQLRILKDYIASIAPELAARRQLVPIVLATQGLPTNEKGESSPQIIQEFMQALRALESFPVWVVLRLCTDDEKTFEFYNNLDSQMNLSNDVLDDFYGEGLEVYLRNPWLCYALVLHRYRESGFRHAVLDTLDERALTLPELRQLGTFLFGVPLPDPTVDWNGFLRALEACMARERPHFNPVLKKVTPWINLQQLNAIYSRPPPPAPAPATVYPPPPQPSHAFPVRPPSASYSTANPTPPPQPSASVPPPASPVAATATTPADLSKAIETTWSKQPPAMTQNKSIAELLGTLHQTFALVETHEYFSKYHPFSKDALSGNDPAVLKRAVRKTRLFLHPDKLPKDLNEKQKHLCRVLWDTVSEAWNAHTGKS